MLCLTKIRRSYIIDHVMPSDLDSEDIKHGLYLKEKLIDEVTDDYIKQKYPNWKELERQFRKDGSAQFIDKIMCGEMDPLEYKKTEPVRCEVWVRYKEFKEGEIIPHTKEIDEFGRYETYDFDRLDGYSDWIKQEINGSFTLRNVEDIMVQFQLAIIGKYCIRYYPFQDASHYNGFSYVHDNVHVYNPQVWKRDSEGKIIGNIEDQTEYYRLFFKLYKGYYDFQFEDDYKDWIEEKYPDENVRTLQTDPIRLKCDKTENSNGDFFVLNARQWIKTKYLTEVVNVAAFKLNIDNLIGV